MTTNIQVVSAMSRAVSGYYGAKQTVIELNNLMKSIVVLTKIGDYLVRSVEQVTKQ